MRSLLLLVVPALLAASFAGCIGAPQASLAPTSLSAPRDPLAFARDGDWSHTLIPGTFAALPFQPVEVPSFDGTPLSIGLYLPDVPPGTKVPVIFDAGPYYGNGEGPMDKPTGDRLTKFMLENFVPQGYAVALGAVRGTGLSGGCNDFMGVGEQGDLDAMVTWLGEQPWSNGNVGMIGKSYDGSTPWEVAQFANPHLKTIVPLNGVTSLKSLHFINGTAEGRTALLWLIYWTFALNTEGRDAAEQRLAALCPDALLGLEAGTAGQASGDPATGLGYWEIRDFGPRAVDAYEGSVFLIAGLQDWNVHPDVMFPLWNHVKGDKKALLGQWGHDYPDRPKANEHATRYDFAEMLLRWFDKYLKGEDVDTGAAVEVEDNTGVWRVEPTWPPADAKDWVLKPGDGGTLAAEGVAGEVLLANPGAVLTAAPPLAPVGEGLADVWFTAEPLPSETRIAGMPQLPLTVIPLGPGGHAVAGLYDMDADGGPLLVGHGFMDFRFADGSAEASPVTPAQPLTLAMQIQPMDAVIPAGHRLGLRVSQDLSDGPFGGQVPSPTPFPFQLVVGGDAETALRLPVIMRDAASFAGAWPFGPLTDGGSAAPRP
jgi:X-Pro dipeptidyl-peptidase